MSCSVPLSEVKILKIWASIYLLEGINKLLVEYFSQPFNIMLHQERVKQVSSGVSMVGDSMSTLMKIKSMVKLANTSYHSLCASGEFNVTTVSFHPCFNYVAPNHGIGS